MYKKNLDITASERLDRICQVSDKIISVYSLEKHVWADSNADSSRRARQPNIQTIKEFQIDPVRPFLTDILRNMAAPYKPERRDSPIGQGYWIQAEFGSGKSHLLCLLSALTLGDHTAWNIIQKKEQEAGRGKRESLYRFWEEGLEAKGSKGNKKGIFVIVKTLVGSGGGTIGLTDKGQRLSEYILDAAKEQLQMEVNKNLSLYPAELIADRFISEDLERYRHDLGKFLHDPGFFEEDEREDVADFIRDIQQNKSPEYKRSCGNKLWRFYTEYLKVKPQIAAETEDILKHLIETILAEGYSGVLLVLDEVSLFMKNRDEDQRSEDEESLVVLSNRLAKVHNLPIWTVCSAQQAIESKMGVKNIIADDRLKLVKLLEEDKDYYDIVLFRVRKIKDPQLIRNYYLHYKRGFTWPSSIGEEEFRHFFPFHKPALEVLRSITYELTTARSAIHFMHQTLKHQIKNQGRELIRLWELFDEAVRYEEDPSGVHAGLVAIKTKREGEYRAYESCKRQIEGLTKGPLKVYRARAIKIIQTLFLYHIAKTRQQGITPEEIANSVLIERDVEANPDENIQHYEHLAEKLKVELRQIVQNYDEDNRPRYKFDPVFTGVDPRDEFRKARDEMESHAVKLKEAWEYLLALDKWPIKTRQMTIDLANGVQSTFRDIAAQSAIVKNSSLATYTNQTIEVNWQGRQVSGRVEMRDLGRIAAENLSLPAINSDQTDADFAAFISIKPVAPEDTKKLLTLGKDPRVLLWAPAELTSDEKGRLLDFAAYRKLISDWQGKDTEDAQAVINWVANTLQTEMGKIARIVDSSYARGRIDSLNNLNIEFHMAGELPSILTPLVERILTAAYESREIKFDPPLIFKKEEGIKVINGIVKTSSIPKNVKPNKDISAAQNFGFGLKIIKKSAEKILDYTGNPYVQDIWDFINNKLPDEGQTMNVEVLYKNFMGILNSLNGKNYGLSRRIVQIYFLCLVKQGKIRLTMGPKSGLSSSMIDYSNIADIIFSAKVLDSLIGIQKMAQPENWEVLRPYAEKLLSESIPSTRDDAVISKYRIKLRELFHQKKSDSAHLTNKAKLLFEILSAPNPYDMELAQVTKLFSMDIENGHDINLLLHALKVAFEYKAFDTIKVSQPEVDDLADRLKNYRDLEYFLGYDERLRTANEYCTLQLPSEYSDLKAARKNQRKLNEKLSQLQPFIDSEVKLKTELIGKIPPEKDEIGTLEKLIYDYTIVYTALHDSVIGRIEKTRKAIEDILGGDELKALRILEEINALRPEVADNIEREITNLVNSLFTCQSPSPGSIKEQLKNKPLHDCLLSFQNADLYLKEASEVEKKAHDLFYTALDRKMEVFFNPKIQERLLQGKAEPMIAEVLKCKDSAELRTYLVRVCLKESSIIDIINRYLKRIVVKSVKIADFKPSINTVEKGQITNLAREFEVYLETQLKSIEPDDDALPMLQLE